MMHHAPRQSLYPPSSAAQQSSILASLQSCVASTQRSADILCDTTDILAHAIQDFPRLKVVLTNKRHYDLLSERDIHRARSHISSEVLPHINQLVQLASTELEKLERKAQALQNKTAAQEARLASLTEAKSLEGRELEAARRKQAAATSGQQGARAAAMAEEEEIRAEKRRLEEKRTRRVELMKLVERLENGEVVDDAELASDGLEEEEEEL